MPGTLYLVATPIGNLKDITFRALEVLREVDVIACEDTRHTLKLLNHYRISNRLVSYHEHNEQERAEQLVEKLVAGESVAIVSDAGTPGICDPAFRIVQRAIEIRADIVSIPGAVAFVSAVVSSGIATDSIFFDGFLPSKKGERRKRLEEIREIAATLLFYEAPHRLSKSLADCFEILGDRRAVVAREMTKLHEEMARGMLSQLALRYQTEAVKGEIVLVIERGDGDKSGASKRSSADIQTSLEQRVLDLQQQGLNKKAALKKAAKEFGLSRSEAYRRLIT